MSYQLILDIAAHSEIAKYSWPGRGRAPIGYVKGMALSYARVYCKLKNGNEESLEMAKSKTADPTKDVLQWYSIEFDKLGIKNDDDGVNTLRSLFMLMMGLGMRESSGRYCEGRDRSAQNTTAETAEAGLFQTSYNARAGNYTMTKLFEQYIKAPSGFQDVFKEGVRCREQDWENYGVGKGRQFQQLSKECPAFAVEFAAVGLRNIRTHWGPINRKAAEVRPECAEMFLGVEKVVDSASLCGILI